MSIESRENLDSFNFSIGGFMLTSLFTFFAHLHTALPTEENLLGVY